MLKQFRFVIVVAIILLLSCQQKTTLPQGLTEEDRATIRAATEAYVKLVSTGNWEAVRPLITDDIIWMRPDQSALEGKQAVMEYLLTFPAFPNVWFTPIEIEGMGDLAFVRGNYGFGEGDTIYEGKYIEIRRKQADGSWPISRTIYNSNAPTNQ